MTKHVRRSALLLALASLLIPVHAGAASAAQGVRWNGHTSEGMEFGLRTVRRDGVRTIVDFHAIVDLRCSVTGEVFTVGLAAFGFDIPAPGGDFAFDDVFLNEAFHFSGHLGTRVAKGSISYAFAALTPEEEAQVCGTGPLGWKANREAPAATTSRTTDLTVTITGGGRTVKVESAGFTRVASVSAARLSYFGKTGQEQPIGFDIVGRPGNRSVRTLIFGSVIRCPETPEIVSEGFWFAEGHLADLHQGAFSVDAYLLTAAFHVSGSIATEPARGTVRDTFAAFTEDEQLQVCTSGDVAWKASRVSEASSDEGTTSVARVTRTVS